MEKHLKLEIIVEHKGTESVQKIYSEVDKEINSLVLTDIRPLANSNGYILILDRKDSADGIASLKRSKSLR